MKQTYIENIGKHAGIGVAVRIFCSAWNYGSCSRIFIELFQEKTMVMNARTPCILYLASCILHPESSLRYVST